MYAGFLHDAVVLYALAVHDHITLGGNFTDGRELMEHMTNRSFEGLYFLIRYIKTVIHYFDFLIKGNAKKFVVVLKSTDIYIMEFLSSFYVLCFLSVIPSVCLSVCPSLKSFNQLTVILDYTGKSIEN